MFIIETITYPLLWLLKGCYDLSGTYFTAVILFTLLTKIILFPVSVWTHKNSLLMVRLMPAINRLKEKYFGDKDAVAERTQVLYKRMHYHPLLGVVPMLIQLVLLLGVIGAVHGLLSGADSILTKLPAQAGGAGFLMPVAAALSALLLGFFQNRLNPLQREQSKASQWTTNGFSIAVSLLLGAFVPIGVGVYWIFSNLFTILQQLLLNAIIPPAKFVNYKVLEQSQKELEKINSLSKQFSKEDKLREKRDYKRFFSIANKHLVFYSEKSGFYKYFAHVIEYLLARSNVIIHYVTSDPRDAVFEKAKTQPRIKPYFIGEKRLITLMMKMDADIVVMTMPDLGKFHIKRSYVRKDIMYIFMFHWVTSTHMVIREGALDNYDAVLCPGPYQITEINKSEELYRTPKKELIDSGYGLIETLEEQYLTAKHNKLETPQILIGPSWQPSNIMDGAIDEILRQLSGKGYRVIVRPHPEYIKRYPHKIDDFKNRYAKLIGKDFELELDFSANDTVYQSDILITDWSNIAYEFAFSTKKPVLFINTPPKVFNLNYEKLSITPLDLTLRGRVGKNLAVDELDKVTDIIEFMLLHKEEYAEEIFNCRREILPKYGKSAEICGKYILSLLTRRNNAKIQKRRNLRMV